MNESDGSLELQGLAGSDARAATLARPGSIAALNPRR